MENVVNGVKTIMVKEPLRTAPPRRIADWAMLEEARGHRPASRIQTWPNRNR